MTKTETDPVPTLRGLCPTEEESTQTKEQAFPTVIGAVTEDHEETRLSI